ncbi:putative SOS response-associated peptidase YedK [Rhizobium sp. BK456]|nr:putative SOS response-associated peptidase YedK [Rhizobium sp. BK456]
MTLRAGRFSGCCSNRWAYAANKPATGHPTPSYLRMEADRGTTNVRKLNFPHWKRWFGVENICLVPVASFAEPDPASQEQGGDVPNAWFTPDASKPRCSLPASVCRRQSVRKVREGLTTDDL